MEVGQLGKQGRKHVLTKPFDSRCVGTERFVTGDRWLVVISLATVLNGPCRGITLLIYDDFPVERDRNSPTLHPLPDISHHSPGRLIVDGCRRQSGRMVRSQAW